MSVCDTTSVVLSGVNVGVREGIPPEWTGKLVTLKSPEYESILLCPEV